MVLLINGCQFVSQGLLRAPIHAASVKAMATAKRMTCLGLLATAGCGVLEPVRQQLGREVGWQAGAAWAQDAAEVDSGVTLLEVGEAWASNSVNAVIFRRNSIATFQNHQYVAYYDTDGHVVLAKRELSSEQWRTQVTPFTGNIKDAHNSISIMVDGDGYLHMSWDHHGHPLRYARSVQPGGLRMAKIEMTGQAETNVTYPEFYRLPDGNMIFAYRDGQSGRGNLALNYYDTKTKTWSKLHNKLIDGENRRNAYWQMTVGGDGTLHLSWVWRESWAVETNHDMAYARSKDGGKTWERSTGETYTLPINAANAEYAWKIPQRHELMNQTAMTADENGNPYIVTYWRPTKSKIPQYFLIFHDGKRWLTQRVGVRRKPFSLSGGGTKKVPISRPKILVDTQGDQTAAYVLFRDEERGSKVSLSVNPDLSKRQWQTIDLTDFSVDQWEPTFDTNRWDRDQVLNVYVQTVGQGDGESLESRGASKVYVLETDPTTLLPAN